MASTLDELQQQLLQGDQASGNLAGLNERYERANALRDQPIQIMKGSPSGTGLSAIASMMNSYTGNKRAAALEPQRATAREQMAGAKHALPMYQARQNENRYQEGLLTDQAAIDLAAANRLEDQGIAEQKGAQAQANWLQRATALKAQQDADRQAKLDGAAMKAGSMSPSQIRELGAYRKRIDELSPIVNGVIGLNELLTPYNDPDSDIPGAGRIEGGSGFWGGLARAAGDIARGDSQGEKIFAKFSAITSPLIKESAGLTQTAVEIKRVEDIYGADWMSNEEVFRKQYPLIMDELNADLANLNSTTSQETRDFYAQAHELAGTESVFDTATRMTNPFAPKADAPTGSKNPDEMTDAELAAELGL